MNKNRYWFAMIVSLLVAIVPSVLAGAFVDNDWLRNLLIGICVFLGGMVWLKIGKA